jgi:hypothetical protein
MQSEGGGKHDILPVAAPKLCADHAAVPVNDAPRSRLRHVPLPTRERAMSTQECTAHQSGFDRNASFFSVRGSRVVLC